jgi:hypothetical protein
MQSSDVSADSVRTFVSYRRGDRPDGACPPYDRAMKLQGISRVLLDEGSSTRAIAAALDAFGRICTEVTGITPDAGFDAWDEDRFLDSGIAINPRAAAHCLEDHRRTVVFVRAVHAALTKLISVIEAEPVRVLYAGCGPWVTLLLPVLGAVPVERIRVVLLDAHESSLDAAALLLEHFGLGDHVIDMVHADASSHRCVRAPHLIVVETMHKALEQEPQFAVTANLAPQLAPGGIFVPERIDVDLQLAGGGRSLDLGRVMSLSARAHAAPAPTDVRVPENVELDELRAELVTSVRAFETHRLLPGEAHITGSRPCPELSPLVAGAGFRIEYRPGAFPYFELTPLA